jgi:hypothetical protein
LSKIIVILGSTLLAFSQISLATNTPAGSGDYATLITLTDSFFAWKNDGNDPLNRSTKQATSRLGELKSMQLQLRDMAVANWDHAKQVDYLALRAAMDQHDFMLQVSKPWERDPGFYVDRMQRLTFIDLPVTDDALMRLKEGLLSTVSLVETAQRNLKNVPTDFALATAIPFVLYLQQALSAGIAICSSVRVHSSQNW